MMIATALFKREMIIAWRTRGQSAAHLMFVLLILSLFPFALGPDAPTLQRLAPGLLLLAILLGQLLGFEKCYGADYQHGILDQVAGTHLHLAAYAFIKNAAQWLALMLPVMITAPLLMLLLHAHMESLPQVMLALTLSSLTIQCLGMLGAALTLGAKSAGLLLPLLLIPFYIPVMIFAVSLAQQGFSGEGLQACYFLGALLALYATSLPFLSAAALRSAIEVS